jgi:colanic acid/amylovoran biosynthesis protein
MVKQILLVNLHSSANAGDHALTLESLRQLRETFPSAQITCAYNDPTTAEPDVIALPSFFNWVRRRRADGTLGWNVFPGFLLIITALLPGLLYRLTGKLPRWWFTLSQYELLKAYAHADVVVSSAGNVFYSSGTGLNLLVNYFTFAYGAWLGKPIATLPQSFGPVRHGWEKWLLGQIGRRARLLLAREPVSARLLAEVEVPSGRYKLVPDVAFAYQEQAEAEAKAILGHFLDVNTPTPLLGITMINWGAQNRAFGQQEGYEAAITATIRRFLAESNGQVLLFAQVWGPTPAEDDRIPARRIASIFADSGKVHFVDAELNPAQLKGCYAHLDLLLGTRMHSNIFALSVGIPVVAIGYFTKTAGIMEMAGLSEWMIGIEFATDSTLPPLVMKAWHQRDVLRRQVATTIPPIVANAASAATLIQSALPNTKSVPLRSERSRG